MTDRNVQQTKEQSTVERLLKADVPKFETEFETESFRRYQQSEKISFTDDEILKMRVHVIENIGDAPTEVLRMVWSAVFRVPVIKSYADKHEIDIDAANHVVSELGKKDKYPSGWRSLSGQDHN